LEPIRFGGADKKNVARGSVLQIAEAANFNPPSFDKVPLGGQINLASEWIASHDPNYKGGLGTRKGLFRPIYKIEKLEQKIGFHPITLTRQGRGLRLRVEKQASSDQDGGQQATTNVPKHTS
jgi:hypothetical protein